MDHLKRNLGTTDNVAVTSVAYIVLYIVTAVVCLLFVVIIGAGAYRAVRHPERYGPRRIIVAQGQQRQQGVVKGLSQAVLDSFPVVSFGARRAQPDLEAGPGGKEIELSNSLSKPQPAEAGAAHTQSMTEAQTHDAVERDVTDQATSTAGRTTPPPAINAATPGSTSAAAAASSLISDSFEDGDNSTTCPICVEDFEAGDQVRVLPCDGRHRFHAQCVDPYLLKHSSLCPLCRKDLKGHAPVATEAVEAPVEEEERSARSRRLSGLMNAMTARRRADAEGGDGRNPRNRSTSRTGRAGATPTPTQAA